MKRTARQFQIEVLERDEFCVCGFPAQVAHHLPDARSTGKRYHDDIALGIGLCAVCHDEAHRGEQTFFAKWNLTTRGKRK